MSCESCKHWKHYQVVGIAHGHAFKAEEVGCELGKTAKICGSYEARDE